MKKGKAAGISIAVIAVVIVFGIASLPDEVLLGVTGEHTRRDHAHRRPERLRVGRADERRDEPERLPRAVLLRERVYQERDAAVNARVDDCRAATLDDQVTCVLQRTRIFGVDGDDAIIENRRLRLMLWH